MPAARQPRSRSCELGCVRPHIDRAGIRAGPSVRADPRRTAAVHRLPTSSLLLLSIGRRAAPASASLAAAAAAASSTFAAVPLRGHPSAVNDAAVSTGAGVRGGCSGLLTRV